MAGFEEQRLLELGAFVNQQYDAIAAGDLAHGTALREIAAYSESLNGGSVRQAIRDMARVMVGDDVTRPRDGGVFWVEPLGRIQGSSGFRPELQDDSAQILHAVAGLYMAAEYGGVGTTAAIVREAYTNVLRADFEAPDYRLYLVTDLVAREAITQEKPNPLAELLGFRRSETESLSSLINQYIVDQRTSTFMLREHVAEERRAAMQAVRDDLELSRFEDEWGHDRGSMGRSHQWSEGSTSEGSGGMGFHSNDPRGPWQDPGIAYTPPGQKPRGWNDPDVHPAAAGSQGFDEVKITQESIRNRDDDDRPSLKPPPPPGPPKHVPRETVFTNDRGQRSDDPGFIGAHPILLDLDGDGIEITELDRSTVFMDASGSGLKHRTAWAGKGDGALFWDGNSDGEISDDREYIFTEWDKTAGDDLAALRSRFDTNGDGKLSGTELASFKVMVTNTDGSQTAQTLAALGITEIRLTPDTTRIALADGSAITGQASFVQSGVTKTLANVTLATEAEAHRVVEVTTSSGGLTTVTKTGHNGAGDVVFVVSRTTNASGSDITTRWDDDGDGVTDRVQTVVTAVVNGQTVETQTDYIGASAATGVMTGRRVQTTSADGKTVTLERDPTGGGWFETREVRVTATDGSRTETLSRPAQDGSVLEVTSVAITFSQWTPRARNLKRPMLTAQRYTARKQSQKLKVLA